MNFLALLLGLGIERALTHFFHLRRFRWLDPLFDAVFRRLEQAGRVASTIALALLALILATPVVYASVALAARPGQMLLFIFAIVVLLFSLGPRDLQEQVEECCAAIDAGAAEDTRRLARELAEREVGTDPGDVAREMERAIFVQANNRIFGVVFWFLVLGPAGPAGAWLFRVLDLMRQRASVGAAGSDILAAACTLHGLAAWLPGRLMAAGFALTGSFKGAIAGWRSGRGGTGPEADLFFRRTEALIASVGHGAQSSPSRTTDAAGGQAPAQSGRSAMALVRRTLWLIWYPVIALLTLNNWLR